MNRALISALAASALALALAAPASAWQQVYQWKDANGVTHYSQTPPPAGRFESRTIVSRQPVAESDQPGEKPVESTQCARARSNIDLINSGVPLRVDSDNDGKPDRDLNEAERQRQLDINQIVLRANCTPASASRKGGGNAEPPPPPNNNVF